MGRRLWAGAEADAIGWGGVAKVARVTGMAISTVRKGRDGPELVDVHDFPDEAVSKAIAYGVYEFVANDGFVSVGTDHDPPSLPSRRSETWWKQVGSKRYSDARDLFITADASGSNGYRSQVCKYELQRVVGKLDLSIHVSHLPPGTSRSGTRWSAGSFRSSQ